MTTQMNRPTDGLTGSMRKRFLIFGAYVVVMTLSVVVLSTTVIPVKRLFSQRGIQRSLQNEVTEFEDANSALTKQINYYKKQSTIEELAHSEYNLAYPGQQIFVLRP